MSDNIENLDDEGDIIDNDELNNSDFETNDDPWKWKEGFVRLEDGTISDADLFDNSIEEDIRAYKLLGIDITDPNRYKKKK